MAITSYGRRQLRRWERELGEQLVQAAGIWLTTRDHRHYEFDFEQERFVERPWDSPGRCGVLLSSCLLLFGRTAEGGDSRLFMLGACRGCGAGEGERHRWDCERLGLILGWRTINPDYWPSPVHRPMWIDDERCPQRYR